MTDERQLGVRIGPVRGFGWLLRPALYTSAIVDVIKQWALRKWHGANRE